MGAEVRAKAERSNAPPRPSGVAGRGPGLNQEARLALSSHGHRLLKCHRARLSDATKIATASRLRQASAQPRRGRKSWGRGGSSTPRGGSALRCCIFDVQSRGGCGSVCQSSASPFCLLVPCPVTGCPVASLMLISHLRTQKRSGPRDKSRGPLRSVQPKDDTNNWTSGTVTAAPAENRTVPPAQFLALESQKRGTVQEKPRRIRTRFRNGSGPRSSASYIATLRVSRAVGTPPPFFGRSARVLANTGFSVIEVLLG